MKRCSFSFGLIAGNYGETAFPQNFHNRKLGEITVFYAGRYLEDFDFAVYMKC